MTTLTYQKLALEWSPENRVDQNFRLTLAIAVAAALTLGMFVSLIKLPKEERRVREAVPERIARFIQERETVKPKPVRETEPMPRPALKTLKQAPDIRTPVTKEEKRAAEKAKSSGMLALGRELSGLMDTTAISGMVGGKTRRIDAAAAGASGVPNRQIFAAESGKGSGGVDSRRIMAGRPGTQLAARQEVAIKQELLANERAGGTSGRRGGAGRGEDELSIAFDQNKGVLYSVYDRARRKNPGLRGKIVLEITIAPGGEVINVRIVSSELGDPELEQGLLRRVRQFKLDAKNVKPVTVTYPIEFLPS